MNQKPGLVDVSMNQEMQGQNSVYPRGDTEGREGPTRGAPTSSPSRHHHRGITIAAQGRLWLLGSVVDGEMRLIDARKAARRDWGGILDWRLGGDGKFPL